MRNLFLLLSSICFLFIFSCSDGDVFTVEFDFDDTFQACEESDLLFYKTKEEPTETLSVLFTSLTLEELFETEVDTLTFEETATFNYRTYNRTDLPNDLFCTIIPPSNLNIVVDESSSCTAKIIRILIEDDNDGIPSEFEGPNGIDPLGDDDNDGVYNYLDDNSNDKTIGDVDEKIEDGFDTDGDGLANFIDADDDGDNVFTKNEKPDVDGDGSPSDAQDFDKDGTPDYLDSDDDGDGTLTRDEENNTQNQNPLDDITNPDVGADYLNPAVKTETPATAYKEHSISQTYTVNMVVEDISLDFLLQEELNFGFLTGLSELTNTRKVTPVFN
ncbi:hypothetical protein [Algibacter sp. 2305UL17-15]|uniref:hypothetical protein n=1 Tax=Algibacter sp. 2305UL17-15 TaxID=3231268 RepID=UPI00345A9E1C